MTWHSFPHVAEEGACIIVNYKNTDDNNLHKIFVKDGEDFSPIEKWCYYEDYKDFIKKEIYMNSFISEI